MGEKGCREGDGGRRESRREMGKEGGREGGKERERGD